MTIKSIEETFDEISQLVARIEANNVRMTETMAQVRGLAPNDVLWCGSVNLAAPNYAADFDFEVPYASVFVAVGDAAAGLMISNGPFPGPGSVSVGTGTVPAIGAVCCVPLTGRTLSIWAAEATTSLTAAVVVLGRPVPPYIGGVGAT